MFKRIAVITLSLLSLGALAAPPTAESVNELLRLVSGPPEAEAERVRREYGVESVREMVYEALRPHPLNSVQIAMVENLIRRTDDAMEAMFGWDAVRPVIEKTYLELFDQQEVDELIAIFQSPIARRAFAKIDKIEPRVRELFREEIAPKKARLLKDAREAIFEIRRAQ